MGDRLSSPAEPFAFLTVSFTTLFQITRSCLSPHGGRTLCTCHSSLPLANLPDSPLFLLSSALPLFSLHLVLAHTSLACFCQNSGDSERKSQAGRDPRAHHMPRAREEISREVRRVSPPVFCSSQLPFQTPRLLLVAPGTLPFAVLGHTPADTQNLI